MSRNRHWTNENNDVHYIYRHNHCHNYLADTVLQKSGFQYDPILMQVIEIKVIIKFNYYTYDAVELAALQCPVKLNDQISFLYFMSYTNDEDDTDSSYFVLYLMNRSPKSNTLGILMYTNRRMPKFQAKNLIKSSHFLPAINEYDDLNEDSRDIRKLLIVPDEYFHSKDRPIVLFGKDAERVFITSYSFRFIYPGLENSQVDKFIQIIQNMRKGKYNMFSSYIFSKLCKQWKLKNFSDSS